MYNNGYMNGVTSKVTLAMRNMQAGISNHRLASSLNRPTVINPKGRELSKRGHNDPYAPKVTTKQKELGDIYFRLVCTKKSLGINIPTEDSMIVKFKDESDHDIKLEDIHKFYPKYYNYIPIACAVAAEYGAGAICDTAKGVKVLGKSMRKTYIDEDEQERLLSEGSAYRVQ
jgi:hypothetical protein